LLVGRAGDRLWYMLAENGDVSSMTIRLKEIYRSAPGGERWLLARDTDSGRVFVRHEPNLSSGGQVADIEIGAFLIGTGSRPEKQELLRLTGTLV